MYVRGGRTFLEELNRERKKKFKNATAHIEIVIIPPISGTEGSAYKHKPNEGLEIIGVVAIRNTLFTAYSLLFPVTHGMTTRFFLLLEKKLHIG